MSAPKRANERVEAVVFDLDGLMVDSERVFYRVGEELMRRRRRQFSEEHMRIMLGRPPRVAYANLIKAAGLQESVDELAEEGRELFFQLMATELRPMPGLERLLAELGRLRLPLAVATSSGRLYTERVLAQFELRDRFEFVLTCDDVSAGKPDPEVYLKAAGRFGLDPQRLLVLEDSPVGLAAAKAAGALCIVVPSEYTPEADWSAADLVARRLDDPELIAFIAERARSGRFCSRR